MRAQYSIEVILVTAGFFILIGLFTGIYSQLAGIEISISEKADLAFEADLLVSRINILYYTGGGQYMLERRTDSIITYSNNHLEFHLGNTTIKRQVIPKVEIGTFSNKIKISNKNGTIILTSP